MKRMDPWLCIGISLALECAAVTGNAARAEEAANPPSGPNEQAFADVLAYAKAQGTTGFLVIRDRQVLVERNWPLPAGTAAFADAYVHGANAQGALLEDVASVQKSFVAILAGIAVDKGLLDLSRPVASYLGAGWSKAPASQESLITVAHLLEMTSGLNPDFTYSTPPGTRFVYNTQVNAALKRVLVSGSHLALADLTRQWLTLPLGLADTTWGQRGRVFASTMNPTGLVTTADDLARLGQLVLDGGSASDGGRILSERQLHALFQRSECNPSYGRLWWLNGGARTLGPGPGGHAGPLIPAAPADLVAAIGAANRRLFVVPSRKLIVVRLGRKAPDPEFDQQLWLRLMKALD